MKHGLNKGSGRDKWSKLRFLLRLSDDAVYQGGNKGYEIVKYGLNKGFSETTTHQIKRKEKMP